MTFYTIMQNCRWASTYYNRIRLLRRQVRCVIIVYKEPIPRTRKCYTYFKLLSRHPCQDQLIKFSSFNARPDYRLIYLLC